MTDLQSAALKNQAIKTALNGDWKNAIELNKLLLEQNPKDIDALNRIALAYAILGELTHAKSMYQRVFEIDPLNTIAIKNLKRLNEKVGNDSASGPLQINCNFLEETGKTKVVDLVNIAQPKVVQMLRTGQNVDLSIKRSKIFVLEGGKQYVGVLPDDIGRRLIKFIKSGNKYEGYVKSANQNKVQIFLKEVKRATRFKNQPSFMSNSESVLEFEKPRKTKAKIEETEEQEDAED